MAELKPSEVIMRIYFVATDGNKTCSHAEKVQELIRCRECKWFGEPGCAIHVVDDTDKPSENDYCSFAERRSDG